MVKYIYGPVVAIALLSSSVQANDNLQEEFNQAYRDYQQAVKSPSQKETLKLAKLSYELGTALYGPNDQNTLNLALNYAQAMNTDMGKEKLAVYEQVLNTAEVLYGNKSVELIDPLLFLANAKLEVNKKSKIAPLLTKAIEIAQHNEDDLLESVVNFEAAKMLFNHRVNYRKAKRYLTRTDEINEASLPKESIHRLEVDMWMASYELGRGKRTAGIDRLIGVVDIFNENVDFEHPIELYAHSRLVAEYEKVGNREAATKHCIAIAKMRPWQNDIEQTPLYRKEPTYPRHAASFGKEGSVQLGFTVTPAGFVEDIKILNPDESQMFHKASIKALRSWRYAPKFVDGKAVAATSSVQLDYRMNNH